MKQHKWGPVVEIDASVLTPRPRARSAHTLRDSAGTSVMVTVSSQDREVRLAVKPAVIDQEQRQRRMNEALRLGFMPITRSTRSR